MSNPIIPINPSLDVQGPSSFTNPPITTLAQALLCDDARLSTYVIQHLPRGIYRAVNVCSTERCIYGAPPKVYRVITLSLNRSQGEASIMGTMGAGLANHGAFAAGIDPSALGTEIVNGMKGVLPLNHQMVKDAKARLTEIHLFIEKENERNFETDLVEDENLSAAFAAGRVFNIVLAIVPMVVQLFMRRNEQPDPGNV